MSGITERRKCVALRAVPDHPKFANLKSILGQPKGAVLGWLEAVWHFTGRFTPQGNIGKYSDESIEAWVEWNCKPGELIAGMVRAGWLDEDANYRLLVHDWAQHADKATKNALSRAKQTFCVPGVGTPCPNAGTVSVQVSEIQEKPTEPSMMYEPPVPEPVHAETRPEPEPEPEPEKNHGQKAAAVIDAWNTATIGKLPNAKLTSKREAIIRQRLKESGWFTDFQNACLYLANAPFYTGQNERGWAATIDFALQAGRATELAEKATQPAIQRMPGANQHGRNRSTERIGETITGFDAYFTATGADGAAAGIDDACGALPPALEPGNGGALRGGLRTAGPEILAPATAFCAH